MTEPRLSTSSHRWAQVVLLTLATVGFLLGGIPSAEAAEGDTTHAIANLYFEKPRPWVYDRVTEDTSLRFVNPSSVGPMGIPNTANREPRSNSIFLYDSGGFTFQLEFDFCGPGLLCGIRLQGTSYDRSKFDAVLQKQHSHLKDLVETLYGPPDETRSMTAGDLAGASLPTWTDAWSRFHGRKFIKLGYGGNRSMGFIGEGGEEEEFLAVLHIDYQFD